MACGGLSNLWLLGVNLYVPREDPEVLGNFARNSVRHGVEEWGLEADTDMGLTVQDIHFI